MTQRYPDDSTTAAVYSVAGVAAGAGLRRRPGLDAGVLSAVVRVVAQGSRRAWACIGKEIKKAALRQQLTHLSDRELKDIAIARGDIEAIADGAYASDGTRCPRSRARMGDGHE